MTEKNRKRLYLLFKLLSIIIACGLQIWAICEKFPIWTVTHGTEHSIGIGAVIAIFVVLIVFRRTIFKFLRDKLNLQHAPPLAIWLVLLVLCYTMVYLGNVMQDMTTVFWMGFIGCSIGTVFTYIAESRFGKKDDNE
jgi:undecaprenyl pyrophosphate phosphatase UppP